MSSMGNTWRQLLGIVLGGACVLGASCATAQIAPDRTLPNNSNVTINGSVFNITGGTQAGRNLFHSFQQFSVPTGGMASFNNGLDIQNIFTRVTGGKASTIDGVIKALGTANLFFLNPNGIVFGQHASLNVGGSFVASTANSLKFADGFEYSATAPKTSPLLTISVPSGLQFGTNPGGIQVEGDGQGLRTTSNLIDTTTGLRVQPDQTLALVGGDITLKGGTLKTAGGRIELGSIAGNSLVRLTSYNKGFSLGYSHVQNFGNIQLSQQAAVDASGEGGGDIQVWGRNITLTNGSQIEASTLGSKPGGSLVVNAQDSVQLIGGTSANFLSGLLANAYEGATGAGGNLTINTHQLAVLGTAQVSTNTYGAGKGGDLIINTRQLSVQGGAQVDAGTFGTGNGGNLTVTADLIQLTGTSTDSQFPSGLFTQADLSPTGKVGDLIINTHQLAVQGGARVSASALGAGNGGNLTVTADSIQLTGASSRLSARSLGSKGDAGNLSINTQDLTVQNGASVSVDSPQGRAGNLIITAKNIRLDFGNLTATTAVTSPNQSGANIILQGLDLLFLQKNSLISAQATSSAANGSNITIDALNGFVVAAPSESNGSNDIVTSASGGRGGNIQITAQSIYGLTPGRSIVRNGTNYIDASSQFNQAGTVNLNTSYLDPSQGLVELPTKVFDQTTQIAQNPCRKNAGGSLTITGRGGLPPNPEEPLTSDVVWTDTRLPVTTLQHQHKTHASKPKPQLIAIIPATGWVFNDKGQVVLTAYDPTNTDSQPSWREPASCVQH
ncbi:MAG: filamentous hemagglutinin N-terminal domain-containing protein [Rhizonema sp. PD37]|nr:filamentous hemagglutinin N-terminal domain-containing protein [Rhizonema sp. PD37]